ncbi:hypothetical protein GJ744_009585 [Endocarpon pusillum]|uniref:Uncharacterized protein n=1 Tax=Endocarpon pusillum TaxID=364733 RepID=A0A8H7AIR2_9EURO|nr:hypothetical protein GJ744_009585 [Endocarpon pusillum]
MYDTSLGNAKLVNSSAEEENHSIFLQQMPYATSRVEEWQQQNERNDMARG